MATMEVRTGSDSSQTALLFVFSIISLVSIIFRLGWKRLHKWIPRLPFKPKWPNFVIAFCQFVPYILLLLAVYSWYYSDVTESSTDHYKMGDYVKELEKKTESTESRLSKIRYPPPGKTMRDFFPREIFQVRVRFRVLEKYNDFGVEEFEKWNTKNNTCDELTETDLADMRRTVEIIKTEPLDKSIIQNSMEEWKRVAMEMKNDPGHVKRLSNEKQRFDTHVRRTRSMFKTILKIWKYANMVFKDGILEITQIKNKEVIFLYGAPAIVAIYFGFWSVFITIFFSQYYLPRMWLHIMKTCFYICAAQAIFLSVHKFNSNNEFQCSQYSGDFELFDFNIPSFHSDSEANTKNIFSKCVENGKSIFSNRAIYAGTTTFITDTLQVKTRKEVVKILRVVKAYDPIVELRKNKTVVIVEKLAEVRKQCPEVENVLTSFNSSANLLIEYMDYEIDEDSGSYRAVMMPMMWMEQSLHDPVLEFNKIIDDANFDCREAHNTYTHGYNCACTAANSIVIEHLEMMVIACSSLLAFFHLFFLRRADHTQFWNDCRVRWAKNLFHKKWDEHQYEEWESVNPHNPAGATYKHFNKNRNKKKNRYPDVKLIDETRVVLWDHITDYIHASWVPVPGTDRKYILTQGPMPNTFVDFWHMVFQEDVKIILMCGGFIEMDRRQCGYYYPSIPGQKMTHGNFEVKCIDSIDPTWGKHSIWDTTTRTIELIDTSFPNCPPKTLKHVFMYHWFDNVVPRSIDRVVFTHEYLKTLKIDNSPIVVHCDTGVGRSAAFVAVDVLKTVVEKGEFVSMVKVANYISSKRVGSMEKHLHFVFCLAAVLHWFIQEMILYFGDWTGPMRLYQDYAENKIGLQNAIRCKRQTSVHYWKEFKDPHWFHTCEIKLANKREVELVPGKGKKRNEKEKKKNKNKKK